MQCGKHGHNILYGLCGEETLIFYILKCHRDTVFWSSTMPDKAWVTAAAVWLLFLAFLQSFLSYMHLLACI